MALLTEQQKPVESQSPLEKTLEDRLDNMRGPYAKIVPLFVEGSIQHGDQITNARWAETDEDSITFRTNQSVDAADIALYVLEDGESMLYLARGYDAGNVINPFIKSPNRVHRFIERKREARSEAVKSGRWNDVRQMDEGEYNPTRAEADAIKRASGTLRVRLSDVVTNVAHSTYSETRCADLEISTKSDYSNYSIKRAGFLGPQINMVPLNDSQRAVAERFIAQGEDYQRIMRMLNSAGIKSVRLTFLYPGYVEAHAKNKPIANTCTISDANLDALNLHYDFLAVHGSTYGRLVGEPKVDYGPIREMLISRRDFFSPERLARALLQRTDESRARAVENIKKSVQQYISDHDGITTAHDPNFRRHGWHLPDVKMDYRLLARTLSSPQWPLRMDENLTSNMAENLFKVVMALYNNAYSPQKGK